MDKDTFQTEVLDIAVIATRAWKAVYFDVEHPGFQTKWIRPTFCECKPYAGCFNWSEVGNLIEHSLKMDRR
jgi:hypothetical protein